MIDISAPVIDFHLHIADAADWYPPALQLGWKFAPSSGLDLVVPEDGRARPTGMIKLLEDRGVDIAVIVAGRGMRANEFVADFCRMANDLSRDGKDRLIPFMQVNPWVSQDPADELKEKILAGNAARLLGLRDLQRDFDQG